jgi:hypothetical protein
VNQVQREAYTSHPLGPTPRQQPAPPR